MSRYQSLINQLTASTGFNPEAYYSDAEVAALEAQLVSMDSMESLMALLSQYLSPALHHTPAGLLATNLYRSMAYKTQYAAQRHAVPTNTMNA